MPGEACSPNALVREELLQGEGKVDILGAFSGDRKRSFVTGIAIHNQIINLTLLYSK
jgi:aminoglycoside phosphotransferase